MPHKMPPGDPIPRTLVRSLFLSMVLIQACDDGDIPLDSLSDEPQMDEADADRLARAERAIQGDPDADQAPAAGPNPSSLRAQELAPTAAIHTIPGNQLSDEFVTGTCRYRVWYGNFGSTPFAKLRMYGGTCTNFRIYVHHNPSSSVTGLPWTQDPFVYAGGADAHGSYFELQATGPDPAYALGASVCPPASQASECEVFRPW